MSSNVKIVLNSSGIRALLKSEEIAGICQEKAADVAMAAGDGYKAEKRSYPERTGYAIYPSTPKAVRDNLKNNTLEKAIRR